jgi:hypothetical protein
MNYKHGEGTMSGRQRSMIVAVATALTATVLALVGPGKAMASTDTRPPTPPTNLRVQSLSFTTVTLAWDASTDDSGWLIYEAEVKALPAVLQRYAALEPAKTFNGLRQGLTYTATVAAVDGARNRSASASIQFTTPIDTSAPSAPSNLRVVADNYYGTLTWDPAVDDSDSLLYLIYADGAPIHGTNLPQVAISELVYTYCVVDPGSTHSLTVRARDLGGNLSPPSNPLTVTFPL